MKTLLPILLAISATLGATEVSDDTTEVLPSREFGYEVFRHLYRWHLDADQLLAERGSPIDRSIEVWARRLEHEQDPEDRSVYIEVLIPEITTEIILKKSDYTIPELGETVKNKDFRIALVDRYMTAPAPESEYAKTVFEGREIFDALYETRNEKVFPDQKTLVSLREALRPHLNPDDLENIVGDQIIYIAPLSPVKNDIWLFWENQRKVIKFTSDADYDTEFYWNHHDIGVDIFDLDDDIVISLSEKPGSNAYMTKDVAGRILFNCVVLGERLTVSEEEAIEGLTD